MARGRNNRGGRERGRGGRGGGGGGGSRPHQDTRQSFDQVDKSNEKLERFYNTLNLVPEGPEREAFWRALKKELPNSFRFTGSKGHALGVRKNLVERFFPVISQIKHEGRPVELPTVMPWYPEQLAYSMTTPKNVIRKYAPFKEFQKFLVSETGVGNISRQEQVSMIPPLVLDVRPEHTVLDLCAAPGSKSAQLIEAIHAGEEDRVNKAIRVAKGQASAGDVGLDESSLQDDGRAIGLLVANDVNYQRAQMLVHQVKRLNSPNLIVTNHDATLFPSIELPTPQTPGQPKKGKYLKFDRILADVPCSGDGTCRKNPSIWKEWNPQNAHGLYITQVRILTRSLQMLKVGGKVAYSTCSMNPMENEAVIASAIERCGGVAKVRLVDCSDQLPGLVRNPGLTDWSIMSRGGQIYESFPEAEQFEAEGSKVVPGMFPPGPEEQIPLQRCMRVYPHQQDTGGFFITILEKLSEIKAKPESQSKSMKKDWIFSAPEAEPPQTEFNELLEEATKPDQPVTVPGDTASAAARQNDAEPNAMLQSVAGAKRKSLSPEPVDGESVAKRPKASNMSTDDPSTNATARSEHLPVPPAVSMALEAANADQGPSVVENGDKAETGKAPVKEQVKDAAANAPFEKSVPTEVQPPPRKKGKRSDEPANEESFKYLSPDHPELQSIFKFYELHDSFPRDRFLVRNPAGDPVKGIYYSSQLAKDILVANEGRGMKFVHAGVKMFMKQDAQGQDICRWRIQTEGLPILEGWVGEGRVVRLRKKSTLRKLLVEMFPKIGAPDIEEGAGWKNLGEIGEQVLNMGMGCCVLRVEASGEPDGFEEALTLPLWRSMHSLNLMLPKEDRRAMLLRIYNEEVELINHSDPSQRRDAASKSEDQPTKGSIPAQGDAEELKERIANDADDISTPHPEVTNGDVVALEEDAVAKRDRMEADEAEKEEDEDAKMAAAMPEREGESDSVNQTV